MKVNEIIKHNSMIKRAINDLEIELQDIKNRIIAPCALCKNEVDEKCEECKQNYYLGYNNKNYGSKK